MRLYHGSNMIINEIDLSKCRPYKDFVQGFYCTGIKEQAELMAKRVARIYGGTPYVNTFELDENIYQSNKLIFKKLESPTGEWAIFVLNNRDRKFQDKANIKCNYDKYVKLYDPNKIPRILRNIKTKNINSFIEMMGVYYTKFERIENLNKLPVNIKINKGSEVAVDE